MNRFRKTTVLVVGGMIAAITVCLWHIQTAAATDDDSASTRLGDYEANDLVALPVSRSESGRGAKGPPFDPKRGCATWERGFFGDCGHLVEENYDGKDFTSVQEAWRGTRFDRCSIRGGKFTEGRLDRVRFTGGDLTETSFSASHLNAVMFRNVTIRKVTFEDAELKDVEFLTGGGGFSPGRAPQVQERTSAERAVFDGAEFSVVRFVGIDLRGSDFNKIKTVGREQKLVGQRTIWRSGLAFTNCDLSGVSFAEASMARSSFAVCDLSNVIASGAGTDLSGSKLMNCSLKGADLRNANLRDCKFRGSDLSDVDLRGTDLTGADLNDTVLQGALYNDDTRLPFGASERKMRGMNFRD